MKRLVYKSDAMKQLVKMVERVAPSQATVLIEGESGTGKELIANEIHTKSNRAQRPFVAINCGALRETLLESELFGHEKGSFTGAYTRKIGLAEVANGGTLFLDEIGELTPGIQAKLLRFLQEGTFYRVGAKDPIKVDVRLVSATNRSLDQEVVKGTFREDLYYRINTIQLHVPALRRRKDDVIPLISHFLTSAPVEKDITPEALALLTKYEWPGNVRELQNAIERLSILSHGGTITADDIPDSIKNPMAKVVQEDFDPSITLHELEKRYIVKALNHFQGNRTQAANALGIGIKTLYNKLHEFGLFEEYRLK